MTEAGRRFPIRKSFAHRSSHGRRDRAHGRPWGPRAPSRARVGRARVIAHAVAAPAMAAGAARAVPADRCGPLLRLSGPLSEPRSGGAVHPHRADGGRSAPDERGMARPGAPRAHARADAEPRGHEGPRGDPLPRSAGARARQGRHDRQAPAGAEDGVSLRGRVGASGADEGRAPGLVREELRPLRPASPRLVPPPLFLSRPAGRAGTRGRRTRARHAPRQASTRARGSGGCRPLHVPGLLR